MTSRSTSNWCWSSICLLCLPLQIMVRIFPWLCSRRDVTTSDLNRWCVWSVFWIVSKFDYILNCLSCFKCFLSPLPNLLTFQVSANVSVAIKTKMVFCSFWSEIEVMCQGKAFSRPIPVTCIKIYWPWGRKMSFWVNFFRVVNLSKMPRQTGWQVFSVVSKYWNSASATPLTISYTI